MLLWTWGCVYLFELQFCLGICPGFRFLDHMATLFLVVWGTSIPFFVVATPICIPTNSIREFTSFCFQCNFRTSLCVFVFSWSLGVTGVEGKGKWKRKLKHECSWERREKLIDSCKNTWHATILGSKRKSPNLDISDHS